MTSLEAVDIVYQHLKNSVLFTSPNKPNGELKWEQRAQGSNKEDVVINGLGLNHLAVQEGVINVNVFVPNLEIPQPDGAIDRSRPNTKRLLELSKLAEQAMQEVWHPSGEGFFEIQQDRSLSDENSQSWYQYFRLVFKNINIR